jgi:hypothetical protein
VELYEQIRREYEHGAGTIRAVARRLGVHRREVCRALTSALSPERKKPEGERPKLSPALPFIDAILKADRKAPRKQRHTAHRIWMRLRQEKPEILVGASGFVPHSQSCSLESVSLNCLLKSSKKSVCP